MACSKMSSLHTPSAFAKTISPQGSKEWLVGVTVPPASLIIYRISAKVRSLLYIWHSMIVATKESNIASIETDSKFAPLNDFAVPLAIALFKGTFGIPDFFAAAITIASRGLDVGFTPCTFRTYQHCALDFWAMQRMHLETCVSSSDSGNRCFELELRNCYLQRTLHLPCPCHV